MATNTATKKKAKREPRKNKTRPANSNISPPQPQAPEEQQPKKREPRMTHKKIWLIFAQVVLARNADAVFQLLGRTFEDHNDLAYWLYRVGHADLKVLRKGNDWIDFLRVVSTRLYRITRDERI